MTVAAGYSKHGPLDAEDIRQVIDWAHHTRVQGYLLDLVLSGLVVFSWDRDAKDVFAYYRTVGRRAVPTVCALLEHVEQTSLHTEACDVLVAIAPDEIPEILQKLDMDKPRVARDVVYLIRSLEIDQIPDVVSQLMYYPDDHVREEVIAYLVSVGSDDAAILLVKLIDDADKRIRVRTLAAVENLRNPIITNKVITTAFDKESEVKGFDERDRLFKTLGRLAGAEIIPRIKTMMGKKNLIRKVMSKKKILGDMIGDKNLFGLGKGHDKERKLLAISALENIADPEVVGIMEELASDSNRVVSSRAKRSLKSLEAKLGSSTGDLILCSSARLTRVSSESLVIVA